MAKKRKKERTAISNIPKQGINEMVNNRKPMSSTEKKVFGIIFGVAGLAILIIILFSVITFAPSTSRSAIAKEYPSLANSEHVFKYTTIKEVKEKINAKETFHLYFGTPSVAVCDEYVGAANTLAKEEYDISTIYYINSSRITDEELAELAGALVKPNDKSLLSGDITVPTFMYIYFDEDVNPNNSLVFYGRSNLLDLNDFDKKAKDLLVSYFDTVFQK